MFCVREYLVLPAPGKPQTECSERAEPEKVQIKLKQS